LQNFENVSNFSIIAKMGLFNNEKLNDDLNKILIGHVKQKLLDKLKINSNLIRVFLSSTFTGKTLFCFLITKHNLTDVKF